jgi:ADP-ribose pyrophosphatase YjhB (NUDIX family)
MNHSVVANAPIVGWTMVNDAEVEELAARYGAPVRRFSHIHADDYIRAYRWRADSDRRAEVVFAIQDPAGKIWVHAKPHYPGHIFRLPSGGVKWNEQVQDALLREVEEETGLPVSIRRFLGLIEYCFYDGSSTANFASYVFLLKSSGASPRLPADGEISAFRAVLPFQLLQLSAEMRNMVGDRRGWGQWRAEVHDLVYEVLRDAGPLGYD